MCISITLIIVFSRLQPVLHTRQLQLQQWKILIDNYCQTTRNPILDLNTCPIFFNNKIESISIIFDIKLVGSLSPTDRKSIGDYIVERSIFI